MFSLYIVATIHILVSKTWASNEDEVNAGEFQEMCAFMRILEARPPLPTVKIGDEKVNIVDIAQEVEKRVTLLNATTTDDTTFSQLESETPYEEAQKNPVVKQLSQQEWERLLELWKEAQAATKAGQQGTLRPPIPPAREFTHVRIGRVYTEVKKIIGQLNQLGSKIKENNLDARKSMLSAVYGRTTVETLVGTANPKNEDLSKKLDSIEAGKTSFGDHAGTCGYLNNCHGTTGGTKVGASIISDIACLCTMATVAQEKLCGSTVNGLDTPTAAWTVTQEQLAKNIHEACKTRWAKDPAEVVVSPEALIGIVARHRGMLGRNTLRHGTAATHGDHQKGSQFILGFHVLSTAAPACTGAQVGASARASNGACVDYSALLGAGKEVPWVQCIQEAAAKLKENERNFAMQLSLIARLESLKDAAELYYETALQGQGITSNAMEASPTVNSAGGNASNSVKTLEKSLSNAGGRAESKSHLALMTIITIFPH